MQVSARATGIAGKAGRVGMKRDAGGTIRDRACIRRWPSGSLRAYRGAEPGMHGKRVAEATAKPAVGTCDGDRKSADENRVSAAAKDVGTAPSVLWKHSRRDFATRFQWRTARLGFEDVDSTRKSLWYREYTRGYFPCAIARIKNARDYITASTIDAPTTQHERVRPLTRAQHRRSGDGARFPLVQCRSDRCWFSWS
jgi:hypothetical protein